MQYLLLESQLMEVVETLHLEILVKLSKRTKME